MLALFWYVNPIGLLVGNADNILCFSEFLGGGNLAMASRTLHSVSLFSNCGAGDVGFAKAGFQFDVMAEIDPRRLQVCLLNHPQAVGVEGDLRETWKDVVSTYKRRTRNCRLSLLAACPPCQGMSTARSNRGKEDDADAGMSDNRNLLVTVIAKVAKSLLPRMIVVENVQAFLTKKVRHPRTNQPISAARLLIDELASNYEVFPLLTDMSWYGVPQSRRRSFLTFVNRKERCVEALHERNKVPFPLRTHGVDSPREKITVRKALKDMKLPKLDARSSRSANRGGYRGLHAVPVWSKTQYSMVAAIPKNSGKSAWENEECETCGTVEVADEDAVCPLCEGPLLRRKRPKNYVFCRSFFRIWAISQRLSGFFRSHRSGSSS